MGSNILISVCIPAYNRAAVLYELLDSILNQDFDNYEVVICEDKSPERDQIGLVANDYMQRYPGRIRYIENSENLGYDGNIRNVIEQAQGEYCFFMGNDDLMCPDALSKVAEAVNKHPDAGVVLRSYAAFDGTPDNITQTFRYFEKELFFSAGPETISTIYRRSVVIPGMVLHRESARKYATDRFDGTLLYQLYLVANILVEKNAIYLPDILVLYRSGGTPDFGNAEAEIGKFVPTEQTPESSLHFMQGMLDIAGYVERTRHVNIYKAILKDIGNYSLPILSIQRGKPFFTFVKYCIGLGKMGFWKNGMFYIYFILLTILGATGMDKLVVFIKQRLGYTPTIGSIYRGSSD
ncbi:MAG: glycosyltransferase family 2 protein [Candidatus Brocadiales bacterium]|nr:glycosyltransferase family 2 protein [Candidatus Brocadiales bacterium]